MSKQYQKKQLYFDTSNPFEKESSIFFSLCGHKSSRYMAFIIHRFLEEHNVDIENCSAEDIKKLMDYLNSPLGKKRI